MNLSRRLLGIVLSVAYQIAWPIWCRLPSRVRLLLRPHLPKLLPAGPFAPAIGGTPFVASRPAGDLPPLPVRVSVVIPTLDAGSGFARTLDVLMRQRGLAGIEVIVVDSGSRDGTPERAQAHGARVVEIPPEEFNHGATRELGACMATGDVLLVTVQDAVLVGSDAVRQLYQDLQADPRCAAISARHVPRSGSDLFAAYNVWAHARAMDQARRATSLASAPLVRRARAQMDDVCALIRREAWEQIRFRPVAFAEDLDFGLRALEAGWTIGTSNAAVVHSHVRSADYHLRRMIVDRFHLGSMLRLEPSRLATQGVPSIAAGGLDLLGELQVAFTLSAGGTAEGVELAAWLGDIAACLRREPEPMVPTALISPLAAMLKLLAGSDSPEPVRRGLRRALLSQLDGGSAQMFASALHGVERRTAEEFVAKIAAATIGDALGDALRHEPAASPTAETLLAGI